MLEREHKDASLQIIPLIHDVLPFTQTPHFSGHSTDSLREYCRRIMPISQLILTVSRSTRDDLTGWMKRQKLTIPRIEVFRLGEDFSFATAIEPDDPFFLKNNIKVTIIFSVLVRSKQRKITPYSTTYTSLLMHVALYYLS